MFKSVSEPASASPTHVDPTVRYAITQDSSVYWCVAATIGGVDDSSASVSDRKLNVSWPRVSSEGVLVSHLLSISQGIKVSVFLLMATAREARLPLLAR